MKAGVYTTDQKSLIYVRKDRSVAAYLKEDGKAWPSAIGVLVSTSDKEQRIAAPELFDQPARRVADVPNGCTDPMSHLLAVREKLRAAEEKEHPGNAYEIACKPVFENGGGIAAGPRPNEVGVLVTPGYVLPRDRATCKYPALDAPYKLENFGQSVDRAERFVAAPKVHAYMRRMIEDPKVKIHMKDWTAPGVKTGLWGRSMPTPEPAVIAVDGSSVHPQMKKVGIIGWLPTSSTEAALAACVHRGTAWMCSKQSARKHRKRGHNVYRLGNGAFVWWHA